jgi:3-hydroxyisobutyrate dehydrogenase-like beta-hydroxyacid dehydrogenase
MAKVGFIGLGVMGSQMVNRLLSKGHTVTGYNRTRTKAQWLVGNDVADLRRRGRRIRPDLCYSDERSCDPVHQ